MVTIRQQNIPRAAMGSGIPDGKKTRRRPMERLEAVSWEQQAHELKTKEELYWPRKKHLGCDKRGAGKMVANLMVKNTFSLITNLWCLHN